MVFYEVTRRPDGYEIHVYTNGYVKYKLPKCRRLHRPVGPSYISPSGYLEYMINDVYHRLDGPAVIETRSGRKRYWVDGVSLTADEYFMKYGVL